MAPVSPTSEITQVSSPPQSRTRRRLLRFVLRFWKPQWRAVVASLALMLVSSVIAMVIPFSAREVASYGGGLERPADRSHSHRDNTSSQPAAAPSSPFGGGHLRKAIGALAERLFGSTVVAVMAVVPPAWLPVELSEDDDVFLYGLLCRCGLMALAVVGYHVLSLGGHLMAYRAGAGAQAALLLESLREVLSSPFPERIAVVNPAQLTQIIVSSARTANDVLASLLTNVLSSLLGAVSLLGAMLYISVSLTMIIGVLVMLVQCVYYVAGRTQHARSVAASRQEAVVHANLSNAIQRSETVYVFQCRDFILERLRNSLVSARRRNDALNLSIHGYACASTSATTLIFVAVLGLSSFLHHKGDLDVMDIGLYFMFVRRFVGELLQLSQDVSKMQAELGRLETLRSTLEWYQGDGEAKEEELEAFAEDKAQETEYASKDHVAGGSSHRVIVDDAQTAPIGLEDVTFYYPTLPDFITASKETVGGEEGGPSATQSAQGTSDSGLSSSSASEKARASTSPSSLAPTEAAAILRGVHHFSVSVTPGSITVLYGPSGCGKSTCLRLLARLVRPQAGTVHTRAHTLLLEQQHAIFLGSIAENILLEDLSLDHTAGQKGTQTEHADRVLEAVAMGGCAEFAKDPFNTYIENVDTPPFSGGQLQRICLSRIFDPKRMHCSLVLLDEPTTGLDAVSASKLLVSIQALRDKFHKTVLIATHDERVANVADRVIRLSPV